jgi:hypothetical protein
MRSDKNVRLAVSQDKFVWAANAAKTRDEFEAAITNLSQVNAAAAQYLTEIPVEKWALYPYYDNTPLHGWRTTNFVESEQAKSLRLKPRLMLPFEFFKAYMTILMGGCFDRVQLHKKWTEAGLKVTPRTHGKIQEQLKEASEYVVTHSSEDVAFVARISNPLKQRRVDVKGSTCSCATWRQQRIPCRHLIAIFEQRHSKDKIFEIVGPSHMVSSYEQSLGSLEVPEDNTLVADSTLHPAPFVRQAGRPKKRRIRSQGETGGKARKAYRCTRCGIVGHNKRTCRAAPF